MLVVLFELYQLLEIIFFAVIFLACSICLLLLRLVALSFPSLAAD